MVFLQKSRILLIITCFIFFQVSLATLNTDYLYQETLPKRNIVINPESFTALHFPPYYEPIINFQFQNTLASNAEHDKNCHTYQQKIDLTTEFSLDLENSLKDFEYDTLILLDKSLLLLLNEHNILYKYSMKKSSIKFQQYFNFSAELQGTSNSNRRLVYIKESQTLLLLSNEKAIGFRNLDDLSDYFTIDENYKKISNIYEVVVLAHLLIVAAGNDGVFLYDVLENSLQLHKHLLYMENSYRISDARDLAFDTEFLYILDKNAGVLFFSLPNFEFQGTNIAIMNGDFLAHKNGELFYISGEANKRYFTNEILYFKENKTFFVNRRTDEILPVKHIEIFGDYVFVLSGETMKIFYHSIPTEWVNYRHNLVNFSTEKGLKNFFSYDPAHYKDLIGFTHEKIVKMNVRENPPYIICRFQRNNSEAHKFQLDVYSKNCMKMGNRTKNPIYSLCHGTEIINIEVKENEEGKLDMGYHSFVISIVGVLSVILVITCFVGWFFYVKYKRNIRRMNLEMENMKKRVKYEQIKEELEISKVTNTSKEIA